MAKLTLRKVTQINDVLTSVENTNGFNLETSWKMAAMKDQTEPVVRRFLKQRDKLFSEKAIKDEDISKLQMAVDYINVGIKGSFSIQVRIKDFEEIDEKLGDLLDTEMIILKDRKFKLSDFEKEITETAEDGKKPVKKKVMLVTSAFLRAMTPFIEGVEVEQEELQETE